MKVLQIGQGQLFGVQYLISGTIFHNFTPGFIMGSVPKKTVREILLGRWTALLSL